MARPLLCCSSYHFTTDTCSLYTQTEDINDEDCSSLYSSEPITETAGDPGPVQKSSLVTGVASRSTAKEGQLETTVKPSPRLRKAWARPKKRTGHWSD